MSVTAPAGSTGTIDVPTYGTGNPVLAVNERVVWSGGAFTLTTGITGGHGDGDYVDLAGVQAAPISSRRTRATARPQPATTASRSPASRGTRSGP
jgi:alpha-L-rhamnosidase